MNTPSLPLVLDLVDLVGEGYTGTLLNPTP